MYSYLGFSRRKTKGVKESSRASQLQSTENHLRAVSKYGNGNNSTVCTWMKYTCSDHRQHYLAEGYRVNGFLIPDSRGRRIIVIGADDEEVQVSLIMNQLPQAVTVACVPYHNVQFNTRPTLSSKKSV
jgi:hypothetical protein